MQSGVKMEAKAEQRDSVSIKWGSSPQDVLKVYGDDLNELNRKVLASLELIKNCNQLKEVNQ